MTHAEIIRKLIDYKHINISQLSKNSGVNRNTLGAILNRNQQRVRPDIYMPIANCLDIPYSFFEKEYLSEDELDTFFHPITPKSEFDKLVTNKFLERHNILDALNKNPINDKLLHKLVKKYLFDIFPAFNEKDYFDALEIIFTMYDNNLFYDEEFHNHILNIVRDMPNNETNQLLTQYKALNEKERLIIQTITTKFYEYHLSEKKHLREHTEALKSGNHKYNEGIITGKMNILIGLVEDGILTLEEAALRASMSPDEFKSHIEDAYTQERLLNDIYGSTSN